MQTNIICTLTEHYCGQRAFILFISSHDRGGDILLLPRLSVRPSVHLSVCPSRFRADSGTNLFKQGEIVAGRPCGSVSQLARVPARYARGPGSSPGRAMCFFLPCDTNTIVFLCYTDDFLLICFITYSVFI